MLFAASAHDPDLAPFVGDAHLAATLAVLVPEQGLFLSPLSSMERDEARSAGHRFVDAEQDLGLSNLASSTTGSGELLASLGARLLELSGVEPGKLLVAGSMPAGDVLAACTLLGSSGWSFSSGHVAVRRSRMQKTDVELQAVRHAAAGACASFHRVAEVLRSAVPEDGGELWLAGEPVTVGRLKAEIAKTLAGHRLEQPSGSIVAPGAEGAVPHNAGSPERRVLEGESVVVDLFPKGSLYADCTRTFCVGAPPEALERAHRIVLEALRWSLEECRPGKEGWALQQGVCRLFTEHGYETPISAPGTRRGYVHGLGHGVGYELHELPHFREKSDGDGLLTAGAVVTLEPGLYDEETGYGVRLEDLVVVGAPNENLTEELPYALDPRAWL